MKRFIMSVALMVLASSCATKEQINQKYTELIKNEADCDEVTDLKVPEEMTTMLGSAVKYINAKCDGKRVRCKHSLTVNALNAFLSKSEITCKVLADKKVK